MAATAKVAAGPDVKQCSALVEDVARAARTSPDAPLSAYLISELRNALDGTGWWPAFYAARVINTLAEAPADAARAPRCKQLAQTCGRSLALVLSEFRSADEAASREMVAAVAGALAALAPHQEARAPLADSPEVVEALFAAARAAVARARRLLQQGPLASAKPVVAGDMVEHHTAQLLRWFMALYTADAGFAERANKELPELLPSAATLVAAQAQRGRRCELLRFGVGILGASLARSATKQTAIAVMSTEALEDALPRAFGRALDVPDPVVQLWAVAAVARLLEEEASEDQSTPGAKLAATLRRTVLRSTNLPALVTQLGGRGLESIWAAAALNQLLGGDDDGGARVAFATTVVPDALPGLARLLTALPVSDSIRDADSVRESARPSCVDADACAPLLARLLARGGLDAARRCCEEDTGLLPAVTGALGRCIYLWLSGERGAPAAPGGTPAAHSPSAGTSSSTMEEPSRRAATASGALLRAFTDLVPVAPEAALAALREDKAATVGLERLAIWSPGGWQDERAAAERLLLWLEDPATVPRVAPEAPGSRRRPGTHAALPTEPATPGWEPEGWAKQALPTNNQQGGAETADPALTPPSQPELRLSPVQQLPTEWLQSVQRKAVKSPLPTVADSNSGTEVQAVVKTRARSSSGGGGAQSARCCAACGATGRLRRCIACDSVRYCGPVCQRAHFEAHQAHCLRVQLLRLQVREGGEGSVSSEPLEA